VKYFSHDTTASSDPRIEQLRFLHGGAAVDAYWTLLEMIYEGEKPLEIVNNDVMTRFLSRKLCLKGKQSLTQWVSTMVELGLFEVHDNAIISKRALSAIADYQALCAKNAANGKKGGRPKKNQEKATGNRLGFEEKATGNPEESDPKPNKRKEKGNTTYFPFSYEGGAEKAAPLRKKGMERCPKCGVLLLKHQPGGGLYCLEHGDVVPNER